MQLPRWTLNRKRIALVLGVTLVGSGIISVGFLVFGGGDSPDPPAVYNDSRRSPDSLLARLQVTPTPSPTPSPTNTPQPTQEPAPVVAEAVSPLPSERGLTAAEVIECEFGQFDGWDDAFNLRPYGFTPFPTSLTLTTDPVACEAIWLTAYGDGYSRGMNDKCGLISDYIEVASPQELEVCSLEAPPPPTPAPYVPNLQSPGEAIIFAIGWMCCEYGATIAVAVDNPRLYYSDLWAFPQDCIAEFDINYIWWVVQCEATEIDCFGFGCAIRYTTKPMCVSDLDHDVVPCGHLYGF